MNKLEDGKDEILESEDLTVGIDNLNRNGMGQFALNGHFSSFIEQHYPLSLNSNFQLL